MFVTPYNEEEIFPSDIHINQNLGGEDFGLQKWVNRDENVRNADIICWPCFGVTHISRPEDWPIMPVEILRVHLKPSGFFDVSPPLCVAYIIRHARWLIGCSEIPAWTSPAKPISNRVMLSRLSLLYISMAPTDRPASTAQTRKHGRLSTARLG
jgi:hypothetical protein